MELFSNKPLKGFLDEYPEDMAKNSWITDKIDRLAYSFGYSPYDAPILEPIDFFSVKSGDELIKEQSYSFTDRGNRNLIMRPEMTPSLARMISSIIKEKPRPFRWYSIPKCYRYERPQKGRLREFKQLNFDLIGDNSLKSDLEMLTVVTTLMKSFGVDKTKYQIFINDRGLIDTFLKFHNFNSEEKSDFYHLVDKSAKLSSDDFERLLSDTIKDIGKQKVVKDYLKYDSFKNIIEVVENESTDFSRVKLLLQSIDDLKLDSIIKFNPSTVRGLDYYTGLVFEVYDVGSDINRALFGGGRYDNLLALFSKESVSGIGFGMGLPIIKIFLEKYGLLNVDEKSKEKNILAVLDDKYLAYGLQVAEYLRSQGEVVELSVVSGNIKKQLQRAVLRDGSKLIIIGEDEYNNKKYSERNLESKEQILKDFSI